MHPSHPWLFQFGAADDNTSCEKYFMLASRRLGNYKGARFYNGKRALMVKWWLNRAERDVSGLTFEESDQTKDAHASQLPVGHPDQFVPILHRWLQAQKNSSPPT